MIAIANHLVGHVGDVGRNVGDIGTVIRIGLEEFVPQQDSVLVGHVVEIGTSALPHPVADHVQIGESVHVELRVQPFPRHTLHAFVESPVTAAHHHAHTIDGDGEIF